MDKRILPLGFESWMQVYLKTVRDLTRHGIEFNNDTTLEWTRLCEEFGMRMEFAELDEGTTIKDLKALAFDEMVAALPTQRTMYKAMNLGPQACEPEDHEQVRAFTKMLRQVDELR